MGIGTIRNAVELFEQRGKARGGLERAFGLQQQAIHGPLHRRGFVQARGAGKPFDLVDYDRVGNLQGHDELLLADQCNQYTSGAGSAQFRGPEDSVHGIDSGNFLVTGNGRALRAFFSFFIRREAPLISGDFLFYPWIFTT
jgi:hypothetical protein